MSLPYRAGKKDPKSPFCLTVGVFFAFILIFVCSVVIHFPVPTELAKGCPVACDAPEEAEGAGSLQPGGVALGRNLIANYSKL